MSKIDELIYADRIESKSEKWTVSLDGEYLISIKEYLKNKMHISDSGINKTMFNAAKILSYCPNPNNKNIKRVTGLMIGKVQSGKTSTFITTIATGFDNGYNIAIVLGGTNNSLLAQNKDRVKQYFKEEDSVVILSTKEDSSTIEMQKIKNFLKLGKKIIVISLKNQTHIYNLQKELFKDDTLTSQPVLIIDDEGDEYTLNTKYDKKKESANYKAIKNLRNSCDRCAFLSVTATPQANIIVPTIDVLSPDFCVLVEPGEGYCGLDVFHDVDSPYCIEIPNEEQGILDGDGIPKSFYDAMSMFFVAATIYHERYRNEKGKKEKFSMLVHPAWKNDDLTIVHKYIEDIFSNWSYLLEHPEDLDYDNLIKKFKESYDSYKKAGADVIPFEEVKNNISAELLDCGRFLITGQTPLNDQDKNYTNNIYIGGIMVGRGLTFSGLAITYIVRSAKGISNVDTVQQRARWFGCQMTNKKYLDLCRIFATEKILSDFDAIREHEEELWQSIKEFNQIKDNFKNMKRVFYLPDDLRPARTSIGKTEKYSISAWSTEKNFVECDEYQENNISVMKSLLEDYKDSIEIESYGKNGGTKHKVIRGLSFKHVVDVYLSKFIFSENSVINTVFLKRVCMYLEKQKIEPVCDLNWPRYNYNNGLQKVKVIDGKINNYMVGKSPKNAMTEDEIDYCGDREVVRGNVIEIQFHNILDKKTGRTSLCLAVYMPPNYRMKNLITTV